jgi:hypothetical protein
MHNSYGVGRFQVPRLVTGISQTAADCTVGLDDPELPMPVSLPP